MICGGCSDEQMSSAEREHLEMQADRMYEGLEYNVHTGTYQRRGVAGDVPLFIQGVIF